MSLRTDTRTPDQHVVVIGGGPSGYEAAITAGGQAKRVRHTPFRDGSFLPKDHQMGAQIVYNSPSSQRSAKESIRCT